MESILDMVKVVDFALRGGKVAIHCHAGLGRTGVLIACYLVYSQRMSGDEAITLVRSNRCVAVRRPVVVVSSAHTLPPIPHTPSSLHLHTCSPPSLTSCSTPTPTDSTIFLCSPPSCLPPPHLHRPGSIQTRPQIEIVQQFDVFLCPLWNFYPPQTNDSTSLSSTFEKYLHNQSLLLHGTEKRDLKYIPKVRVPIRIRVQ